MDASVPKKLLLIDLSAVYYWKWHASAGKPVDTAYQWTINKVRELAKGFDHHVGVCCDSGRSFRHELDPSYKATRPPRDPAMMDQLYRTIDTLEADGMMVWRAPGFEGDDLIATAVAWAMRQEPPMDVTIAGTDKDLIALIQPGVTMLKVTDGSVIWVDKVREIFGIDAHQFRDFLALVGDSADNIKGCPGVGQKHASRLLTQFGTIDGIYANMETADADGECVVRPESIRKALVAWAQLREKTLQLVTLRSDAPIDCAAVLEYRAPKPIHEPRSASWEEEDNAMNTWDSQNGLPSNETQESEPHQVAQAVAQPPTQAPSLAAKPHANGSAHATAPSQQAPTTPAPNGSNGGAKSQSTALAVVNPLDPTWSLALEPRSPKEAMLMAESMFASKLFGAYGNPDAVLAMILMGRSMGLDAMTSLRGFHVIEGRPSMSAALMVAVVLRSGKAHYFRYVEGTAEYATYETHRVGDPKPIPYTYTLDDARTAKLIKAGGNWEKSPKPMLRARASSELARAVYQDVLLNCYLPDELSDNGSIEALEVLGSAA